jgi:hypothetical protein
MTRSRVDARFKVRLPLSIIALACMRQTFAIGQIRPKISSVRTVVPNYLIRKQTSRCCRCRRANRRDHAAI